VSGAGPNGSESVIQLVLATANADKAKEIEAIMRSTAGHRIVLLPRPSEVPDVEETGDTLEENAGLKARALARATAMPAIADDTGLEVDALGGAPGVRSSRYSGENASYEDNVAKLLYELNNAGADSEEKRTARFRTVALASFPDGHEVVAHGVVEGHIAAERRGENGFGYDPVFVPEGSSMTFAEMDPQEKHGMSHRGRAFRALAVGLTARTDDP
jgi:XTP/dITP diphosphohydrolase